MSDGRVGDDVAETEPDARLLSDRAHHNLELQGIAATAEEGLSRAARRIRRTRRRGFSEDLVEDSGHQLDRPGGGGGTSRARGSGLRPGDLAIGRCPAASGSDVPTNFLLIQFPVDGDGQVRHG